LGDGDGEHRDAADASSARHVRSHASPAQNPIAASAQLVRATTATARRAPPDAASATPAARLSRLRAAATHSSACGVRSNGASRSQTPYAATST